MKKKTLSRREFLKAVVAGAAAGGLSHFRVLNFGGASVVLADDDCTDPGGTDPDICDPPENPDTCDPPEEADNCTSDPEDFCRPHLEDPDECSIHNTEDFCIISEEYSDRDACLTEHGDPDYQCDPLGGVPDDCLPQDGDPDLCDPPEEPDECLPPDDVDYFCPEPGSDLCGDGDPDLCIPWSGDPDVCDPGSGEADEPTPVTLTSLTGATSVLPALGAAVAGLGWAALRSARREEDEEDTPLED
jgi:hypothetical protein